MWSFCGTVLVYFTHFLVVLESLVMCKATRPVTSSAVPPSVRGRSLSHILVAIIFFVI